MSPILLPNRQIISVSGVDAKSFLQGLISNDIEQVSGDKSIYAAFLSAQGKFLHDLFISSRDGEYLIDCESARAADLVKRLTMYKLRAQVDIKNRADDFAIMAVMDGKSDLPQHNGETVSYENGILYRDPRLADIGWRMILPKNKLPTSSDFYEYDYVRAKLGLPDGSRDMEIDRAIILENGFQELNAIDWQKGCYVGQELTARTKYRGLVRKRLLPCEVTTGVNVPEFGTKIELRLPDGMKIDAGETRSAIQGKDGDPSLVLALLRLEHVMQPHEFYTGNIVLRPYIPHWMRLPEQESEEM
ncbi:MAG: folate-binding protein [Alphaproteobacteria bacterium]|nr:MAG: folate-binding protein [Alphaproteobacteria bacterium]